MIFRRESFSPPLKTGNERNVILKTKLLKSLTEGEV